MDPSWNPATDLQAIDRAYRLGQKRDVNVYRLITTGTLEEVVYTRQLYKQQQSNVAVENANERRYFDGERALKSWLLFCGGKAIRHWRNGQLHPTRECCVEVQRIVCVSAGE